MTEEQIERQAEREMDALDRRFLKGGMTQAEYDAAVRQLNARCEARYRTLPRR